MKLNKKSLTLTELVIAVALLGTVFAAATNFNLASYNIYYSSDKLVETQLALSPAMEMIIKNASQVVGDTGAGEVLPNAGFFFGMSGGNYIEVHMRLDMNNPHTPGNYNDDTWVGFWRRTDGSYTHDLVFCPNCDPNVTLCNGTCNIQTLVSGKIVNSSDPGGSEGFKITDNIVSKGCIDIQIIGRFTPSLPVNPLTNPEVTFASTVCPSGLSVK